MTLPQVIDVHSHLYLARAKGGGLEIRPPPPRAEWWSVDGILAMMEANNIGISVLSQPQKATWYEPQVAREINETFHRTVNDHPDRFGAFAVLPLGDTDATLEEIGYSLDHLHLDGVLLNTNVEGAYLGEPRFAPIWAELDRRGAVAFVHPTIPPHYEAVAMDYQVSLLEYTFESTRTVASLVYSGTKRRHPNVKVITTHGGGAIPFLASRIAHFPAMLGTDQAVSDADGVMRDLKSFYFDLTAAATPYALPSILELVDPSKLMMGFDYPIMTVPAILPAQAEVARQEGLTQAEKASIFSGNARALLPLLGSKR